MTLSVNKETITSIDQLDFNKNYTYPEYLTWQFEEMVELIKGQLFKMSSAPSITHQEVLTKLIRVIDTYLIGKPCKWFPAPFDVRFPNQNKQTVNTVVQPDLCVICDLNKLDKMGCQGAPDLAVEVLSPGNTSKEMNDKYNLYESEGVKEYWLVHPTDKWLVIYHLNKEDKYIASKHYTEHETALTRQLLKA